MECRPDIEYAETGCSVSEGLADCHRVLTDVFGLTGYKGKQKEIIEAAKLGWDVIVIAPTGMGKSLCFQIPAVSEGHGVTIVISPLLALMKNQVSKLREHGVPVVAFTSETSPVQKRQVIQDLQSRHPKYRLIYVTPEKMCSKEFVDLLGTVYDNRELNRLVVDEAHCISEWGHDFRTEYRRLGSFRDRFPNVPIMALTASATAQVQDDIVASLKMSRSRIFKAVHPFNRANLYYEVRYLRNPSPGPQMEEVYEYISSIHRRRARPSSGIIYCRTRVTCDELAGYLRNKGLSARPYHRGIKVATLDQTLEEWQTGGTGHGGVDVVVATIAFGCGIDKGDVRYIIHYDLPKSLEGYYQETGRAGRDGSPAKCILYYSREDAIKVRKLVSMSYNARQTKSSINGEPPPTQRTLDSLNALIDLAESTTLCRHVSICRYFGESIDDNDPAVMKQYCENMCDVCKYPAKTARRKMVLSSEEFVSSQLPRLEQEADPTDCDGEHPPGGAHVSDDSIVWEETSFENTTGNAEDERRTGIRTSLSKKASLETKRSRPPDRDAGNAAKKARTRPPTLESGQVSSHLQSTFRRPFKTPFKDTLQRSGSSGDGVHAPISEASTLRGQGSDNTCVHNEVTDEEETGNAIGRSPSPVDFPNDEEVEIEAAFSQKVPSSIRKEYLISIRKALHKVFMGSNRAEMWRRLKMEKRHREIQIRILSATAKELEFVAFSYSSTPVGYRSRALAQVSAIKLLRKADAWSESVCQDEEWEDAREVSIILLRICSEESKE